VAQGRSLALSITVYAALSVSQPYTQILKGLTVHCRVGFQGPPLNSKNTILIANY
jgi:hypothetical protein